VRRLRIPRIALFATLLALLAVPVALGAVAPQPGQRIDLKVLLISANGNEATFSAWKAQLDREGVPYDTIIADNADGTITDARLADYSANYAKYQAVILSTGDLVHQVGTQFVTALNPDEWAALDRFELTFGIRQLSDATQPSAAHGLNFASSVGAQDGQIGQLTAAGQAVFPYLQGPVPIDNSSTFDDAFGYQATPAFPSPTFETLLTGPNNSSYLGIYNKPDGREEMVMTVDSNQFQNHAWLLRHGMLNWVTRGYFLGTQRNYFEMHIDDIFLPDDRWDTVQKKTGVEGDGEAPGTTVVGTDEYECTRDATVTTLPQCPPVIRMLPADVDRAIAWQNANGLKFDMVFNGFGSTEAGGAADPLTQKFLADKNQFPWINHTWSHPNLNTATQATIESEISQNQQFAAQNGLPIDPSELVTGEHSAVGNSSTTIPNPIPQNPALAPALATTGIQWIASDNSREQNGAQRAIGPALTVPRYPSNIYYNVGTMAEQLDEYNHIYLPPALGGVCVASATNTCRTAPATQQEYLDSETNIMFSHLMLNDPRPHYAHQSNLAEEGTVYPILNAVIARYKSYFKAPLVQDSQKQAGQELQRQSLWKTARDANQVSGYLLDGQIHIQNRSSASVEVPVTGVESIGDVYGGIRSGWATVAPNSELVRAAPSTGQPVKRAGQAAPPAKKQAGKPKSKVRKLRLTKVKITPSRFSRRSSARISWSSNRAARLRLGIEKSAKGKRVRATCQKPTKRLQKKKNCTRYIPQARINKKVAAGNGRLKLTTRVGKHRLRPGIYRLRAVLTDGKGNHSPVRNVKFVVKR
jgi:hypothetical protein